MSQTIYEVTSKAEPQLSVLSHYVDSHTFYCDKEHWRREIVVLILKATLWYHFELRSRNFSYTIYI